MVDRSLSGLVPSKMDDIAEAGHPRITKWLMAVAAGHLEYSRLLSLVGGAVSAVLKAVVDYLAADLSADVAENSLDGSGAELLH